MKYIFILKAVLHSISHRKFSVFTSIFAISAAFAFLAAIGCVSFGLAATAVNSSLAFPLVVGPAGASDTTLVMSTLFNTDKPAGTLDYEFAGKLASDERVSAVFPVARSDSYMGVPITGVESAYINEISRGFSEIGDDIEAHDIFGEKSGNCAVIGSKVAARYEMKTGDTFFGSHGSVGDEEAHMHDFEYTVCAVMKAVNGPEDFAIFTNLKSVWEIHKYSHHHGENEEHEHHHETAEMHCVHDMCVEVGKEHHAERKITAVLVKTKNPVFTAALEREYSENGFTSATDTGRTVRKLMSYMNKAEEAAGFFSYGTLFLVMILVFVTILTSINERKREMALMRTLGIGKLPVSLMIFLEMFFISVSGIVIGTVGGHLLLAFCKPAIDFELGINLEPFFFTGIEIRGMLYTIITGVLLSLAAMAKIYRMDLVEEIAKE
ncbi:ABC transporter permease [bacterium]|nr:ABC transporter permease [bacterium]MBP5592225.1 ABC transporter permease [bacterium]